MNALTPFQFETHRVRVVERDGAPWFVGNDVCAVLGLADSRQALDKLDEDERGGCSVPTPSGEQEMRVISEGGLYTLILRSRDATKPGTVPHRFRKWVTGEVLPAIRRTGSYSTRITPAIDVRDPSQLATIAIQLIEVNKELEGRATRAEAQVEAAKPKMAFFDRFANADGLYGLQNAARVLGEPPNKFIGWLKAEYLFYQGGALVPKANYRAMGVFEVKATMVDDKARYQAFVTPKGIQYLARKLGKHGDLFGAAGMA